MKKKRVFSLLLISMVFLAGSCKESRKPEASGNAGTEPAKSPVQETRTVSTLRGGVEIPADPKRIADASGVSDMLCIIGRKPVATADSDAYDYSRFPSYLEELLSGAAIIGYPMTDTIDIEGVLEAEPDLILINPRQEKALAQLKAIAPTIVIEPTVNDWRSDLRMVAALFGAEGAAEQWIAEYEAKAAALGERIRAANGEDAAYFSFLTGGSAYYLFTGAAYGDMFYNDLGLGIPANLPQQDSITLPTAAIEGLAGISADYIVALGSEADKAALEAHPLWKSLETVQAGKVLWLPQSPYFNQAYSVYGRMRLLDELETLLIQ
jgi:iron complex transport system substrate-binding protein